MQDVSVVDLLPLWQKKLDRTGKGATSPQFSPLSLHNPAKDRPARQQDCLGYSLTALQLSRPPIKLIWSLFK